MSYLLDTNIVVHFFRNKFSVAEKLFKIELRNCAISELTLAELYYGAEKSLDATQNQLLIESFLSEVEIIPIISSLKLYAKEKVRLRKKGIMIGEFDLLIGVTAIVNKLIMVTENTGEFSRIDNIKLENWIVR